MRYVPVQYVREGSYLAKPLMNEHGHILLNEGVKLSEALIHKIKKQGYYAVYVQDELSDYILEDVLKPELKQKVLFSLKGLVSSIPQHTAAFHSSKVLAAQEQKLQKTLRHVINDLFLQKDVVLNLLDIKKADDYTYGHSVNVMLHSIVLGIGIGLNREELYDLALGSLLHDIGKLFTPEEILKKPGKLTKEEYAVIQTHTTKGFDFLRNYTSFSATSRIVSLQHQERIDGSGYPRGLTENELHQFSKITAIADVYDALTSDRYYRSALPTYEALEYILAGAGRYFNMDLTKAFINRINPYPLGTLVKLSNGMEGIVDKIFRGQFQRPVVKVIMEEGRKVVPWELDLSKERNVVIKDIIYHLAE